MFVVHLLRVKSKPEAGVAEPTVEGWKLLESTLSKAFGV
jgi:hypothetical protein